MAYIPKDEKPKVEKVTTQPVQVRKKSRGKKFLEAFVDEDAGNLKDYLFFDLFIPALKDGLANGIKSTVDMVLYGRSSKQTGRPANTTYVSYSSYSNKPANVNYRVSRRTVEYDDIIFQTRTEAEHVLETLLGMIEQYGSVSIADYYDCCGVTGRGYTDNDFGWVDLRGARVERCAGAWTIQLPRAIDIK